MYVGIKTRHIMTYKSMLLPLTSPHYAVPNLPFVTICLACEGYLCAALQITAEAVEGTEGPEDNTAAEPAAGSAGAPAEYTAPGEENKGAAVGEGGSWSARCSRGLGDMPGDIVSAEGRPPGEAEAGTGPEEGKCRREVGIVRRWSEAAWAAAAQAAEVAWPWAALQAAWAGSCPHQSQSQTGSGPPCGP